MDPMLAGWIACPRCGGELTDAVGKPGVRCQGCGHEFGARERVLDLVDPEQRVSSEGPGDTLAMAWRRRRWDELRGSAAPENAAYLSAIWERLRPDDRVVDLGCGPGTYLGWMAEFAPDLAILGLDLSWPAIDEAGRVARQHPNVRLARASTRRRLPIADASTDIVLRRLAPALPEEAVRVLAPGGHYLRFTFGAGHWQEVYERVPGLPRAREDAIAGEVARLNDLGLEVMEPTRIDGSEEVTSAAVLLALRSNPAAFHMDGVELAPLRRLWFDDGRRRQLTRLSTEYIVLVARKPAAAAAPPVDAPPAKPRHARKPIEAPAIAEEPVTAKPRRPRKSAVPTPVEPPSAADMPPSPAPSEQAAPAPASPAPGDDSAAPVAAKPRRTRRAAAPEPAAAEAEPPKAPRARRGAAEPASTEPPASPVAPASTARRPRKSAATPPSGESAADAAPKPPRRRAPRGPDA